MNATLVRVGVDQAFGGWNAPVDPDSLDFVYVPIPESDDRPISARLATHYADVVPALASFAASRDVDRPGRVLLPADLAGRRTHLDPDFAHLTYGDDGTRRGKGLTAFEPGDLVVFFAGLRPCRPCEHRLVYAIIGALRVAEVVRAGDVPRGRRGENAHTRRADVRATDVIVRGEPGRSGRLRRCIPIGSYRDGAYRVRPELLAAWGGLSVQDGFIQRSAVPPRFTDPARFERWLGAQRPEWIAANNPPPSQAPVIFVMLRRPFANPGEARDDPFYEFGCFGLTGCHQENLLAGDRAEGARLAFVQGGHGELRLVHVTPPVRVERRGPRRVATWAPAEMPLRFEDAPVLVENRLAAPPSALRAFLRGTNRDTPVAQFASRFRSRSSPLPPDVAREVVELWERAMPRARRSNSYVDSLPYPPPAPRDAKGRQQRFAELLEEMGVGRPRRRC